MKDIIWTKDELKNIKKIILTRANLTLTNESELKQLHSSLIVGQRIQQYTYTNYKNEIEELFYTDNKKEITSILDKASKITFDPNNPKHIGFISTISKLNPTDASGIFVIFKEIISQYERITSKIAQEFVNDATTIEGLVEKTHVHLHKNHEESIQSKTVINEINELFSMCNGAIDSELFQPIINKLNETLQHRINAKILLFTNLRLEKLHKIIEQCSYEYTTEILNKNRRAREL